MDDNQFEQQMKLLKKTYERVPSKFIADEVLQKIEEEGSEPVEVKPVTKPVASKWQKVSVWAISLASIFLIGILSASFLNNEEQGDEPVSEFDTNDSRKLEKEYKAERVKRQKILHMTNEQFDELGFVQFADQVFAQTIHPDSIESRYSTFTIEERFEQAVNYLKLPSEIIEEAQKAGKLDEEKSMQFLDELNTKLDYLKNSYDELISKHHEIMSTAKYEGELNADYLYGHRSQMPEPIENALVQAPKQGVAIEVAHDKKSFVANFQMSSVIRNLEGVLAEPAVSYLEIKELGPFTLGGELLYEPIQSAAYLQLIESTLLKTNVHNAIYTTTKAYYEDLAYTLIFESSNNRIIENSKIKLDYAMAWDLLRATQGYSPIKHFIEPLYNSMVENEWLINETYKSLDFNDLSHAFILAESGDLAGLMPGKEHVFRTESYSLPNDDLYHKVHAHYKMVRATGDFQKLESASAIEIVALLDYASALGEIYLMHSLYKESSQLASYEEFSNANLQEPNFIPLDATQIRFLEELTYEKNNEFHTSVEIMKDEQLIKSIPLIRSKNGPWQIVYEESVVPAGYYYEPNTAISQETKDRVIGLYEKFKLDFNFAVLEKANASDIAGVYLEAFHESDLETQYELLVKDESLMPPREEFISSPNEGGMDWKVQFEAYEVTQMNDSNENDEFDAVVWFDLHYSLVTEDESRKGFQMRKTKEGWRVHFMPFQ